MKLYLYIDRVKEKLNSSNIVASLEIVDERVLLNRGYFRARLKLVNGDFLEIAESFALPDDQFTTLDYRYSNPKWVVRGAPWRGAPLTTHSSHN